jgi:hypothetical protein
MKYYYAAIVWFIRRLCFQIIRLRIICSDGGPLDNTLLAFLHIIIKDCSMQRTFSCANITPLTD